MLTGDGLNLWLVLDQQRSEMRQKLDAFQADGSTLDEYDFAIAYAALDKTLKLFEDHTPPVTPRCGNEPDEATVCRECGKDLHHTVRTICFSCASEDDRESWDKEDANRWWPRSK